MVVHFQYWTLSGTMATFGTTGIFNRGQNHNAVTVTTGTGAWESGGTSFTYVDMVSSV